MNDLLILTINPGSTSTKIALYNRDVLIFCDTIKHSTRELSSFKSVFDQYEFRKKIILKSLNEKFIKLEDLSCIVGRGGLINPIPSGVYSINEKMRNDLKANLLGEHASNLGGLLAYDLAKTLPNTMSFVADPVVVDELEELARFSGNKNFIRQSIFHALNQKATARHYAKDIDTSYNNLNLIVVHLGGGISVGAHKNGKVIDVNDGLNGDGPFSPERSGSITALSLAKLCFSGSYSYDEVKKMIIGNGGITSYLGTNNIKEVLDKINNGDEYAKTVLDAMSYQVCKEIGSMATVLKGNIDAILLTGGIAYCDRVTNFIKENVGFLAPVEIYPGEDEMEALALNGLRVLLGEETISTYEED